MLGRGRERDGWQEGEVEEEKTNRVTEERSDGEILGTFKNSVQEYSHSRAGLRSYL